MWVHDGEITSQSFMRTTTQSARSSLVSMILNRMKTYFIRITHSLMKLNPAVGFVMCNIVHFRCCKNISCYFFDTGKLL